MTTLSTPTQAKFFETLVHRPRRNRKSVAIRTLVQENFLCPANFVAPLFVLEGDKKRESIHSLPGVERLSIDFLLHEVEELFQRGIRAVDLFAVVPEEKKDAIGSEAIREGNLLQLAVKAIKDATPEMCVMVDVALDPYTNHGHDGVLSPKGEILNDASLLRLAEMAVGAAAAGADVIAPSDMMDGRVLFIRQALDSQGFDQVNILSYTAKYASAFYGPFRDALSSAPKSGDKKTYQMNPANVREALLEADLDRAESADMLLIKPALPYLDVLAKIKERTPLPVGAYHVSGEYAMVMAAGEKGWLDPEKTMLECLMAIRRAGADFIFTYAAKMAVQALTQI